MKALLTPLLLSFVIAGTSFSATSLFDSLDLPEKPLVQEVAKGDPAKSAVTAFNSGRHLTAVLLAKPLAEEGNSTALLLMGLAYQSGKGINQSNELALTNYRKAMEVGSKDAPYRLARLLLSIGGDADFTKARSWWDKASLNMDGCRA
jgi:TPR repeat protein